MNLRGIIFFVCIVFAELSLAQGIAINAPEAHESAILDLNSHNRGLLVPRLTTEQRLEIANPANGLVVYDLTAETMYAFINDNWQPWLIGVPIITPRIIDADSDSKVDVEHVADEDKVHVRLSGLDVFKFERGRLRFLNSGSSVFLGDNAGALDDFTANQNIFIGSAAGSENVTGTSNVGIGYKAFALSTGNRNIAIGDNALESNSKSDIVAIGYHALQSNSTGQNNVAIGSGADEYNSDGEANTIVGYQAGRNTGSHSKSGSIFIGHQAGLNESSNNKLYIDNSSTTNPLLYGDMNTNTLTVHGRLGVDVKSPLAKLHLHDPNSMNATMLLTPMGTTGDSSTIVLSENATNDFGMKITYDGEDNELEFSGFTYDILIPKNLVIRRNMPRVGIGTDLIDGNLEVQDVDSVTLILNRLDQNLTGQSKSVVKFQDNGAMLYEVGTYVDDTGLYFKRPDGSATLYLRGNGNVGIGTTSPAVKLDVRDNVPSGAVLQVRKNGTLKMQLWENGGLGIGTSLTSWIPTNGLFVDGDVNIGRAHKDGYKVSVDGKIVAEEVLVEMSEDWPDYVFEEEYPLMPLQELKKVLEVQKHLPGIPSAKEVSATGGIHLGGMQNKLLRKIEELTLYVIELEEKYAQLKSEVQSITK